MSASRLPFSAPLPPMKTDGLLARSLCTSSCFLASSNARLRAKLALALPSAMAMSLVLSALACSTVSSASASVMLTVLRASALMFSTMASASACESMRILSVSAVSCASVLARAASISATADFFFSLTSRTCRFVSAIICSYCFCHSASAFFPSCSIFSRLFSISSSASAFSSLYAVLSIANSWSFSCRRMTELVVVFSWSSRWISSGSLTS
mmetsp:Transcript_18129/g.42601  ORF Transcript_18129/g.42601 Transcript_18129/m.42601 type:complete len:212 (-) Transcript_18129:991-1626(-)